MMRRASQLLFIGLVWAWAARADCPFDRAAVLSFITSPGGIISGQRFGGPSWTQSYGLFITALHTTTGHYPEYIEAGYDIIVNSGTPLSSPPAPASGDVTTLNNQFIDHWNRGGIVAVDWFADNPWYRLGTGAFCSQVSSPCVTGTLLDVINPATTAGAYFKQEMDAMVGYFTTLQAAGVEVLFRPFHEMNGSWFWWGAQSTSIPTASDFTTLWTYVHTYFNSRVTNLIWVYSTSNSDTQVVNSTFILQPTTYYYPGAALVDIIGVDYYSNTITAPSSPPVQGDRNHSIPTYTALMALGRPLILTELGPATGAQIDTYNFDTILNTAHTLYPALTSFMAWQDNPPTTYFSIINQTNPTGLMTDPLIITRQR